MLIEIEFVARETQDFASLQAGAIGMAWGEISCWAGTSIFRNVNTASPSTRFHVCVISRAWRGMN